MLWYKNWLETRSRVVFNLIIWIGFLTIYFIVSKPNPKDAKAGYIMMAFLALTSLCTFMSLAGSGVRTQAGYLVMMPNSKSTVYTLSLPISRCRLVLMRSALGLLEAAALTLAYTILVWIFYLLNKTTRNFTGPFLANIFCGACIYFLAVLLSNFLNEVVYIWNIWFLILIYFGLAMNGWIPEFLDVFAATRSPIGTIPWLQMAAFLVLSGIFLFASIKVVESQEYRQ